MQSLAQKPRIKVDVLINGQGQLLRPMETFSANSESGIIIPSGKGYAAQLFQQRATVSVAYRSSYLLILYLNDAATQAAFQAVRQCAGDHFDPFAAR